jgi:dienelactone hydrolase
MRLANTWTVVSVLIVLLNFPFFRMPSHAADPFKITQELDQEGFFKVTEDVYLKTLLPGGTRPTVLIIPSSGGTRGRYLGHMERKWGRQLNRWGYNAVIIDYYTARGLKSGEGSGGMPWPPFDVRLKDVAHAISYLKSQQWHNGSLGVIGFSKGGGVVIELAKHPTSDIKAGVGLYPCCGCSAPRSDPEFDVQLHIGKNDELSLPELCEVSKKDRYSIFEYDGATHGFDVNRPGGDQLMQGGPKGSYFLRYNPEAAELSSQRTREFFASRLR